MKEQEIQFLHNIKSVLTKNADAVEIIDELAKLDKPSTDGLSVNTLTIIEYINNLEFEREDGELDGGSDDSEDYVTAELKIASENLQKIKSILTDIDNDNWYKQVFWAEFAYSYLQNGKYSYKVVNQKMDAKSADEAKQQKDEVKAKAPKQHPDDPNFKLEDVRVNVKVVDKDDKTVEARSFLLN